MTDPDTAPPFAADPSTPVDAPAYADVTAALAGSGFTGHFTHTGLPGELALEVTLLGHDAFITDRDNNLSADRANQQGWLVELYRPGAARARDKVATSTSRDPSAAGLIALLTTLRDTLARYGRPVDGSPAQRTTP